MDNSHIFDDAAYDETLGLCMIADLGLMGLFIKDCKALIYFSKLLGCSDNIKKLEIRMIRA